MKKLLGILLIIIAGFLFWYIFNQIANPQNSKSPNPAKVVSRPDLSNATFEFEDEPITLVKGTNSTPVVPGSASTRDTILTDIVSYGDLNGDSKEDAVAVLVQESSGSGVFIYLVALVSGPGTYKGSNAIYIGDRLEPKSIIIKNGIITLTYLDRDPNSPMSSKPTVQKMEQFVYTQGTLAEKK